MKAQLLIQFDLHRKLYNNVLDGFTDEETNRRIHGNTDINHVKYLAGHLLNSQYGFGMLAGIEREAKWYDLFGAAGQSEAKDNIEYPTIEKIKTEWNERYLPIREALEQLSPDALNNKPPGNLDEFWDIAGEMWAFLNHHQAYHIGQIAILRRGFGKEPMSYD